MPKIDLKKLTKGVAEEGDIYIPLGPKYLHSYTLGKIGVVNLVNDKLLAYRVEDGGGFHKFNENVPEPSRGLLIKETEHGVELYADQKTIDQVKKLQINPS